MTQDHLNSIPEKTLKITDFWRVLDLPNRAETQARASFSLIYLSTKKYKKNVSKSSYFRGPEDTKIRKNVKKRFPEKR